MKSVDAAQARRICAYLDELIVTQRAQDGDSGLSADDREFDDLRRLAQPLSETGITPPDRFQQELLERLPYVARGRYASTVANVRRWLFAPRVLHLAGRLCATAALVLVIATGVARFTAGLAVAAAKEILGRSNAALAGVVSPGQVLYRKWTVTSTLVSGAGVKTERTRVIEEWMDGSDRERVAARWSREDGSLWVAYTTRVQGGEHRPYVYFSPGAFGERDGVLHVEPTRSEYYSAARTFALPVQPVVRGYLQRQYIYVPIRGERDFNDAVINAPVDGVPGIPRVVVSSDESAMLNGTPVYCIRMVDPGSVTFNWQSNGPPRVRLAAAEYVRYIDRRSYLSVRTEESFRYEDGSTRFARRELSEMRAIAAAELTADPFELKIPEGTLVQHQSAAGQLSAVLEALDRFPAFRRLLQQQADSGQAVVTH